jgi:predicted alpha/beta-hydrolase family hydrolase
VALTPEPPTVLEIDTPHGPARAHVHAAAAPAAALVLGHGAAGGIGAPDLLAATDGALAVGVSVALVEQPYRVAGRRSAAPASQLDTAWTAVLAALGEGPLAGLPVVTGGRSSGARVACRTALQTGAIAVLCLAFPLVAPSGASRQDELDDAGVPVLVVQGASDRFGVPEPSVTRSVAVVRGDHGLKSDISAVADAVARWLPTILASGG